jgi:oligosaccharide repeat unit polymerase
MVLPPLTLSLMKLWQRSRFAASIGVLFAFLVFIVMLQFQLLYRLDNTRTYLTEQFFEDWMTLGGTIDYFKETLLALRLVPTYHDYFKESVLVQFLVSPIPRFIWPEKPASILVWFYTLWRWNIDIYQEGQGGNVFPGVVGQFYMSWGFFGPVIVGGLFGWMAVHIDRFIDRAIKHEDVYRAAIGAMLVIWVVVSFRVLSPGFFYPILVAVAIVQLGSLRVSAQARRDSGRRYRGTARAYLNENANLRNRQNLVPESKGLSHENRD